MRETFFDSWLKWVIKVADAVLRRIGGVTEFEAEPDGLLRIEQSHATHAVTLRDGAHVAPGAPIVGLHFWNEHLPAFASEDADFDWATCVGRQIQASLHRLAIHLHTHRDLDDVQALRVKLSIPKRGPPTALGHLLMKADFELIKSPTSGISNFLPLIEGIWMWLLTWTYNPRGLIGWRFNRVRQEYWISRSRFFAQYAEARLMPRSNSRTVVPGGGARRKERDRG